MIYRSKPHTIEAFQFTGAKVKPPAWFLAAYEDGKAMVTLNAQSQYITVFAKDGAHKAFVGDWVCRNGTGTLFVLGNEELHESFEPQFGA